MSSRRNFLKAGLLIAGGIPAGTWLVAEGSLPFAAPKNNGSTDDVQLLKSRMESRDPIRWVFTGDSITQGAKHTHGMRAYPEIVAERVRWELGRVRDVVMNTAVSGNTTANLLADWEWRVVQFNPHVVSVMMGTNDCATSKNIPLPAFEENMITLVQRVRNRGAIPILHVPTPIIVAKAAERRTLSAYADVVKSVAERSKVICVDHWAYWQAAIRRKGESRVFAEWLNDPLHPNGTGHQEIARSLFKQLQLFDEQAATCGAPYYEGEH